VLSLGKLKKKRKGTVGNKWSGTEGYFIYTEGTSRSSKIIKPPKKRDPETTAKALSSFHQHLILVDATGHDRYV
jgi:hypothetical protein